MVSICAGTERASRRHLRAELRFPVRRRNKRLPALLPGPITAPSVPPRISVAPAIEAQTVHLLCRAVAPDTASAEKLAGRRGRNRPSRRVPGDNRLNRKFNRTTPNVSRSEGDAAKHGLPSRSATWPRGAANAVANLTDELPGESILTRRDDLFSRLGRLELDGFQGFGLAGSSVVPAGNQRFIRLATMSVFSFAGTAAGSVEASRYEYARRDRRPRGCSSCS